MEEGLTWMAVNVVRENIKKQKSKNVIVKIFAV